jgi:hypothetical protein
MTQSFEDFLSEQEARIRRDLTEGTILTNEEIEREVRAQIRDLEEGYE